MAAKRKDERMTSEHAQSASAPRSSDRHSIYADRDADNLIDERERADGRELDDRDMTDEDFLALFRDNNDQSILPSLPVQAGFHVCWLTTANPRDTIAQRMRMGYTLIRTDELSPDWAEASIKTGSYSGCVGINEMVAAKIPIRLYNLYMREAHSTRPAGEESKLRSLVENIRDQADRIGLAIEEGDGMESLGKRAPAMAELRE